MITVSSSWFVKLMAVFCTTIFIVTFIPAIQGSEGAVFGLFIFAGPFMLLSWSLAINKILVSNESVTVRTILGYSHIKWDDVEDILLKSTRVALVGKDKSVILKLDTLGVADQKKLIAVLIEQSTQRQIQTEYY